LILAIDYSLGFATWELLCDIVGVASMNWRKQILLAMLLTGALGANCSLVAQTTNAQLYSLLSGSQLVDDCPMCGRPTILASLTGTFTLSMLDQNPLFTRYQLTNISFHAGAQTGLEYKVVGTGIYQVGGEVALLQDLFLDVAIDNGSTTTKARCVNTNRDVSQPWPEIQISVDQTNGTPGQVYYLTLVAVPVPKVYSFPPDPRTGNVHLEWNGNGGSFQVERAPGIGGPFSALTPITTNASFTDIGVLTNYPQVFYRVRQF
jgi:hypothetical protein